MSFAQFPKSSGGGSPSQPSLWRSLDDRPPTAEVAGRGGAGEAVPSWKGRVCLGSPPQSEFTPGRGSGTSGGCRAVGAVLRVIGGQGSWLVGQGLEQYPSPPWCPDRRGAGLRQGPDGTFVKARKRHLLWEHRGPGRVRDGEGLWAPPWWAWGKTPLRGSKLHPQDLVAPTYTHIYTHAFAHTTHNPCTHPHSLAFTHMPHTRTFDPHTQTSILSHTATLPCPHGLHIQTLTVTYHTHTACKAWP